MSKTYRIASYCRVSTTRQIDNGSIGEQEAKARALCHERGYELVEVYRDEGVSGSLFTERGELQRLISDAKAGRFQFVLIAAVDRLARTEIVFAQIVEALEYQLKIQVVDTLNPEFIDPARFNPRDRGRRLMAGFKALLAQDDYFKTIETLSAGKRRAIEAGKYIFVYPPFGYRIVYSGPKHTRDLVPDPATYPALDTIMRLAMEGVGAQQIARRLDGLEVPTVRGGRWNSATILSILKNPFFAGQMRANGELYRHAYPHPWEWEEWEALQEALKGRARRAKAVVSSKSAFSPVLRCGYCGGALLFFRQTSRGKPFDYYLCRRWRSNTAACRPNMIPTKKLIPAIASRIDFEIAHTQHELDNPGLLTARGVVELQRQLVKVKKRYEALLLRGGEIDKDYVTGQITRTEHDRLRAVYFESKAELEAESARLAKALEAEQARVVDSRKFKSTKDRWQEMKVWLNTPVPDWTPAQKEQCKKMVNEFFSRIVATNRGGGRIEIEFVVKPRYVISSGA